MTKTNNAVSKSKAAANKAGAKRGAGKGTKPTKKATRGNVKKAAKKINKKSKTASDKKTKRSYKKTITASDGEVDKKKAKSASKKTTDLDFSKFDLTQSDVAKALKTRQLILGFINKHPQTIVKHHARNEVQSNIEKVTQNMLKRVARIPATEMSLKLTDEGIAQVVRGSKLSDLTAKRLLRSAMDDPELTAALATHRSKILPILTKKSQAFFNAQFKAYYNSCGKSGSRKAIPNDAGDATVSQSVKCKRNPAGYLRKWILQETFQHPELQTIKRERALLMQFAHKLPRHPRGGVAGARSGLNRQGNSSLGTPVPVSEALTKLTGLTEAAFTKIQHPIRMLCENGYLEVVEEPERAPKDKNAPKEQNAKKTPSPLLEGETKDAARRRQSLEYGDVLKTKREEKPKKKHKRYRVLDEAVRLIVQNPFGATLENKSDVDKEAARLLLDPFVVTKGSELSYGVVRRLVRHQLNDRQKPVVAAAVSAPVEAVAIPEATPVVIAAPIKKKSGKASKKAAAEPAAVMVE